MPDTFSRHEDVSRTTANRSDALRMAVTDQINSLVQRADSTIKGKTRRQKLRLYAEGLKAKIKQADFALSNLSTYAGRTDEIVTPTDPEEPTIADHVHFYCDSFWTFLYSSLDVLGQIVNQALDLKQREKDVGFKQIAQVVSSNSSVAILGKKLSSMIRSRAFKSLDDYRNCSTHRRQIYIEERKTIVTGTAGYRSSTGPIETVQRVLCDNPLELNPKTRRNRIIPEYMEQIRDEILSGMEKILKAVNPVP